MKFIDKIDVGSTVSQKDILTSHLFSKQWFLSPQPTNTVDLNLKFLKIQFSLSENASWNGYNH